MELSVVWFVLLGVLFAGFFFLEGFDYGVGTLLPFLGKTDTERRLILSTIGPVWDGNEVWMITAGGAMFAAFPHVYATLFSGFYLALFLLLLALIGRGVGLEYRSKREDRAWRACWDWVIFIGSCVPAVLWGVTVTNLLQGVPIDRNMHYAGTFLDLLSPYALMGGITFLLVFIYHGAVFLALKLYDGMAVRARMAGLKAGVYAAGAFLVLQTMTWAGTSLFSKMGAAFAMFSAVISFVLSYRFLAIDRPAVAFVLSGMAILFTTGGFFAGLFPCIVVSSLDPAWSLTIANSSSSQYTLRLMTIAAAVFVPVVLAYQAWSYWIFHKRITRQDLEY